MNRRFWILSRVVKLALGVVALGSLSNSAMAGCDPMSLPILWLMTSPSPAGIQPDAWTVRGKTVHLVGKSAVLNVSATCDTSETPSSFTWSASFQGLGAVMPVPVTLTGASSTTPSFNANDVGVYTITLVGPGMLQTLRIESIEGPDAWLPIGPSGLDTLPGATVAVGRVNAIVADSLNPAIFYAGTSQGGVFRSLDRGRSWWPISEHAGVPAMEVDALASANDGTMYAAFGERGKDRSGFNEPSVGLWKLVSGSYAWSPVSPTAQACPSTSATGPLVPGPPGRTERILATWPPPGTSAIRIILAKLFHFSIPTDLVAATTTGVFWSSDGGLCWRPLLDAPEVVTDIALVPGTTDALVVASASTGLMQIDAFRGTPQIKIRFRPYPTGNLRIRLAPTRSAGRLYAIASLDASPAATSSIALSTTDGGLHWQAFDTHSCTRQCDWFPALTVDPTDDNRLYYGEVKLHVSANGGQTFNEVPGSGSHVDIHAVFFPPDNPNLVIEANDGGLFQAPVSATSDRTVGAWQSINRYLQTNQCATFASPPSNSGSVLTGCWDNGYPLRSLGRYWSTISGGDGEGTAFDGASNGVVFFHLNAVNGSDIFREQLGSSIPGNVIGAAGGFATNPYQSGQIWAMGLQSAGDGALYAAVLSGANPPVQWHCVDPDPQSSSGPYAVAFTQDGWIFSGRWDGSVRRFRVDDLSTGTEKCVSGTSAATDVETVSLPLSGDTGLGVGIAVDGASADHVVTVIPGAKDPERRILEISRGATGPGATWTAVPRGGGLPLPSSTLITATVVGDGSSLDRLFVGSQRGLWQGLRTSAKDFGWAQPKGFPDAWVSHLETNRIGGQVIRASTYGRGIWELRNVTNPATTIGSDLIPYPNEHMGINFPLGCLACTVVFKDPTATQNAGSWTAVSVVLPTPFQGSLPDVRVLDTAEFPASKYFQARVTSMDIGGGSAHVALIYAGLERPPGLFVRVMRLQFTGRGGNAVSKPVDVRLNYAFHRPEFARVRRRTVIHNVADVDVPSKIKSTQHGRPLTPIADGSLIVPIGSTVEFTTDNLQKGARFSGWNVQGTQSQYTVQKLLRLVISSDTSVSADYDLP